MKLRAPLPLAALVLTGLCGCTAPPAAPGATARDSTAVRDLCYRKVTTGAASIIGTDTLPGTTDSLLVRLHITGERVTGEMSRLPGERDRMTGTLVGTLEGARIVAIYSYTAEGGTAKEEKIMRIGADGLHLKNGELEEREGIWTLKDTAAAYTEVVPPVPCP